MYPAVIDITFAMVTITLIDVKAFPIGNFFFFSKLFNVLSGGNYVYVGISAHKKNIAIVKNGIEYPNIKFNTLPIIGPNNNPSLYRFYNILIRCHCFHNC